MKTPQEKYQNDSVYRNLVDNLTYMIHTAQYTPSELREAVIFACIRYQAHTAPVDSRFIEIHRSLKDLEIKMREMTNPLITEEE